MFGFVSKRKIIEIVKSLAKEYNNSVIEETDKQKRTNEFYYRAGNCNAINAIMSKLGIKFEEYMNKQKKGEVG